MDEPLKVVRVDLHNFDLTWIPVEKENLIVFLKIVFSWLLVLHSTIFYPDGISFFSQKKSVHHTNLKSA